MRIESLFENIEIKPNSLDLIKSFEELKQTLLEENNTNNLIDRLSDFLCYALLIAKQHKMKFGNTPDSDLNNWALNIATYQKKFGVNNKYFLETTEKCLENFVKKNDKHLLFEIITQTFLFIDFKHYSIFDMITLFISEKISLLKEKHEVKIKNLKKEEIEKKEPEKEPSPVAALIVIEKEIVIEEKD